MNVKVQTCKISTSFNPKHVFKESCNPSSYCVLPIDLRNCLTSSAPPNVELMNRRTMRSRKCAAGRFAAQSAKWTRVDASYPFEIWYICITLRFMKISFQFCTWKCFLMAGTVSMLPMNFPWRVFRSWRRWIQSLSRFPERDPRNRQQQGWRYDGYSQLEEMKLSVIFCFFPLKLW